MVLIPNRYVKTVMADTLNMDLKDNDGGFNCGKPAGWIEDFKSLPDATKELIQIYQACTSGAWYS